MKILWHSNAPWAPTGYGNQTKLFAPRIKALGHEVTISAFYGLEGGIIDWNGIKVMPKVGEGYGQEILPGHAGYCRADIEITLIDAWVYRPAEWDPQMRWVPWFPIDSEPLPPPVGRAVAQAYKRIVFSKFGLKMVENAGMTASYVPHGVDTDAFRPMDQNQARASIQMPNDKFCVGIVGANKGYPSRKAWPEMVQAFAQFHAKHPDSILYCHTNPSTSNGGVNLMELFEINGLMPGRDVAWPNQYRSMIGDYSDEDMRRFYNAFDVHLLASSGEGFGIPVVEAQACGCPVIVGDWTATGELCFSGWKIDKRDTNPHFGLQGAYQYFPKVGAIVDCLNAAYEMKGNQDYRSRARDGALAYDADKVAEKYWKPVLAEIEAGL